MYNPSEIKSGSVDNLPYFLPWIGANADGGSGVRWHVMGESHYTLPGRGAYSVTEELTRDIVRDWALKPCKGSAFFTRVAAIVLNAPPSTFDREDAWAQFAYSNFVQEPLPGPRLAPSRSQFDQARSCFFGQLSITRPEVLIVLGNRCWQQLPDDVGCAIPKFRFEVEPHWPSVENAWFYSYQVDGQMYGTVAVPVVHPSAGFGRWNWQNAAARAQTAMYCHSNILEHF